MRDAGSNRGAHTLFVHTRVAVVAVAAVVVVVICAVLAVVVVLRVLFAGAARGSGGLLVEFFGEVLRA